MKGLIAGSGNGIGKERLIQLASQADIIMAADGGWKTLTEAGIKPDLVLGDYDSLSDQDYQVMTKSGVAYQTFDSEKDFTDMEAAIRTMVQKGATTITLVGAIGSRFDHSLANIFMLKRYKEKGVTIVIEDDYNRIKVLCAGEEATLRSKAPWYYSFLALDPQGAVISLKEMKYNLDHAQLDYGSTLGISNEVEGEGRARVHSGAVLMVRARDMVNKTDESS